jgi:hypothetical protein
MFIDEKGRLFGKINFIDFIVVVCILFVIPLYFIGNKIMGTFEKDVIKNIVVIEVGIKFFNVIPELANALKEGDIYRNAVGKPIGKLIKITSNEPTDKGPREVRAIFELTCIEERGRLEYQVDYYPRIGSQISFTTDLYDIQGMVVSIKRIGK